MLNFPIESIDLARDIARKYKLRSRSRVGFSNQLHNRSFFEIEYGFSEAIRTGKCGRYLHEMISQADCFSLAGALYLIAREGGMNPNMYRATEMRDYEDGENRTKHGTGEHMFITMQAEKNERMLVDPFFSKLGIIQFVQGENKANIFTKRGKTGLVHREYAHLEELSEQNYLEMLEEHRAPDGGRLTLSATQKVEGASKMPVFLTYSPEQNTLTSSIRSSLISVGPEPYRKNWIADLKAPVGMNGTFDFNEGVFDFYFARGTGWHTHDLPLTPFHFNVSSALPIWNIWDTMLKANGRKSPAQLIQFHRLRKIFFELGMQSNFESKPGSIAQKCINSEKNYHLACEEQERSISDFLVRVKQHEPSYKVLLRHSHFVKGANQARNSRNPFGFTSSEKERFDFLKESYNDFEKSFSYMTREILRKARIASQLEKGSNHHAILRFERVYGETNEKTDYFENIKSLRSCAHGFDVVVDKFLAEKQFDLEKMSITQLKEGLDFEDIKLGAQEELFVHLIAAYRLRDSLWLKSYKKGLESILKA